MAVPLDVRSLDDLPYPTFISHSKLITIRNSRESQEDCWRGAVVPLGDLRLLDGHALRAVALVKAPEYGQEGVVCAAAASVQDRRSLNKHGVREQALTNPGCVVYILWKRGI